jgi:hypothetical protein
MTRRKRPKRVRTIPIQVYVSSREHAALLKLAGQRGVSLSELVRGWVRRAAAASAGREPKPIVEDPRQLRLA